MSKLILAITLPTLLISLAAWWIGGLLIASGTLIIFLIIHAIIILSSTRILKKFIHGYPARSNEEKRYQEYINAQKIKYGVERVTLLVAPSPQPNVASFGLNRGDTYIVITTGALELVESEDTKAMLHHALATLGDSTSTKQTIIAVYASIITTISQMGQFSILSESKDEGHEGNSFSALIFFLVAPLASFFIKILADRALYLRADKRSSSITRKPKALADALHKIFIAVQNHLPLIAPNPSLAFLYMVQPLANDTLRKLFNVHPEEVSRIDKVEHMII